MSQHAQVSAKLKRSHLAIVLAVEEYGSLTAAAEQLHITQSALSHTLRKLEDQLGVLLWQRQGRALRLTQAGQYVLALAKRILPQLRDAELRLAQYARGEMGQLRIGMECHPCYQWLLKVIAPYLASWPDVDVDIKQKFQFGGVAALSQTEIDILVTPDPIFQADLHFEPVFSYEQVLVVHAQHALRRSAFVRPQQLADEVLLTYPVGMDRLDIFQQFLIPAGVRPRQHKGIENTEVMLQMVASGRGVSALPRWLVTESRTRFDVLPLRLGRQGITKNIYLGMRLSDLDITYIQSFIACARRV